MNDNHFRQVMNADEIDRTLHRMAYQIWERSARSHLALVGIRSRGATLATRLRPFVESLAHEDIPLGLLDIGLYRDDIGRTSPAPPVRSTDIPFDIEQKDIVLIDDVLYTGRTVRAALNALMDLGRPARVQLLALVDRGGRELPIQADYTGESVKTYENEIVVVRLREEDDEDGVFIEKEVG
ncbi:MAG: bifunctional pyr operon transcriptional regulator/uracil phosphoribosyltransferase PyrR [Candidatus Hinthialibacter antarcticus]|nr:bifunctional pyr operon transcriptional regulator/uracil phosphoribosyltransferase PyrR [Candidatus Hinthialibacter antarcticus]